MMITATFNMRDQRLGYNPISDTKGRLKGHTSSTRLQGHKQHTAISNTSATSGATSTNATYDNSGASGQQRDQCDHSRDWQQRLGHNAITGSETHSVCNCKYATSDSDATQSATQQRT
jgi:hypothetical protein